MSQQNSATPIEFVNAVKSKFNIELDFDLACTTRDAKAPNGYYFDQGIDSLEQDWSTITATNSWLNPPWKKIPAFAAKCAQLRKKAELQVTEEYCPSMAEYVSMLPYTRIFSLWNAGIGSKWFFQSVWGNAAIHVLSPRITFIDPRTGLPFVSKKTGKPQTGLNDCILCDWKGEPGIYQFVWK